MCCKMPVSAALLVSNVPVSGQPGSGGQEMPALGPGSGSGPVRQQQSFARGEKTSSSVRLRKRRDDVTQPGRKINRHSGDFSYFAPRKEEIPVKTCDIQAQRDTGDWNYITFPQGVPAVQEVKIDLPRHHQPGHHQPGPLHHSAYLQSISPTLYCTRGKN